MIDLSWTIDDDGDAELTGAPRPLLSTWHYLRNALRRQRRTWVGLTILGFALAVGGVALMPPGSSGTVTLLMAHPANIEGPEGIAMDLSLLSTRAVAERTVRSLGLAMSPEEFESLVSAQAVTGHIVTVNVSAPDDRSALTRTQTLVSEYLAFRASQLQSLTSGLVTGYRTRIAGMEQQVKGLTTQYNELTAHGGALESQAFEVLARRTELNSQITAMQQSIEDATLQTAAAIDSTHVIDPPHAERSSVKRALALAGASGLIGGGALGIGFVLFRALVSDRLRRRQDVSLALAAPVRFSVRSQGPREGASWTRLSPRRRGPLRCRDLETLVLGLESALGPPVATEVFSLAAAPRSPRPTDLKGSSTGSTGPGREPPLPAVPRGSLSGVAESRAEGALQPSAGRSQPDIQPGEQRGTDSLGASGLDRAQAVNGQGGRASVALAAIGNASAASEIIGQVAARLRDRGLRVFLVDLSASGILASSASRSRHSSTGQSTEVLRPTGAPEFAWGPLRSRSHVFRDLSGDEWGAAWEEADVVLALVEVDPGIDVDNLASWVRRVVPLVSAGRSTAELLETTGELVRAAGLALPFAMMLGCDSTDESLGLVAPSAGEAVQARPQ
ncbi:MAG: hypothetical protein ACTHJJ_09920 [Intrasporangium sp.]|uniref:hypothetical protein n=1 Tax=Intrasporangium sp. TaxID=1925024 RepID=UPI003F806D7D